MYSERENFVRTIKGDNPDRLCAGYEALGVVRVNPIDILDRGDRKEGETVLDVFGTEVIWPAGQPGGMPHVTQENKVIKDIENWQEELVLPNYLEMDLDWSKTKELSAEVNRDEKLLTSIMATGLFERLHFLMGLEDTLVNLLTNPDEMHELLDALLEVRMGYAKLLIENMQPEVIIHHDDWGNKNSLFMQPDTWREFFKDRYMKLYNYISDQGVILIHHADCHLASIVDDMVDLGIDAWQGVIPENDILAVQKQLNGRMALMGGIDSVIDHADWTEEEVRKETRRACEIYGPQGYFIPSHTYGGPPSIYPGVKEMIVDEVRQYNMDTYGIA